MENKKNEICPLCKGSGQRLVPILLPNGLSIMSEQVCVKCRGLGKIIKWTESKRKIKS